MPKPYARSQPRTHTHTHIRMRRHSRRNTHMHTHARTHMRKHTRMRETDQCAALRCARGRAATRREYRQAERQQRELGDHVLFVRTATQHGTVRRSGLCSRCTATCATAHTVKSIYRTASLGRPPSVGHTLLTGECDRARAQWLLLGACAWSISHARAWIVAWQFVQVSFFYVCRPGARLRISAHAVRVSASSLACPACAFPLDKCARPRSRQAGRI
jgi:hypothetical protein